MKKIIFILLLITSTIFSQTSKFVKYFENTDGTPATGKTIVLVPDSLTYPTGSLSLTEYGTRPGMYYRDGVPDGEYSVYIDGTLYLENYYVGEVRLTTVLNLFKTNWDANNFIMLNDGRYIAIGGGTLSGNLIYLDNVKGLFGTGSDFEIYHSGSHAYLYNKTGDLYIRSFSATDQIIFGVNSTDRWKINQDGDLLPIQSSGIVDIGSLTYPVGNIYSNVIYLAGASLTTTLATKATYTAVSDSLLNRKLDPLVFSLSYPQADEIIGPFRMSKDVEVTSSYYYLLGDGSSLTFQIFYATTCVPSYTSGQSVSGKSEYYYGNITVENSTGEIITDDTYDPYIDEGKWVWCKIVSITGTPEKFSVTLNKKGR